jgi:serine/threonine protein kinase
MWCLVFNSFTALALLSCSKYIRSEALSHGRVARKSSRTNYDSLPRSRYSGDLKGKNILVDARFRAKVADFGFSHVNRTGGMNTVLRGTPFYMAPEYVSRRNEYTPCCDIYSLGMVLYEIYARQCPFEGEDPRVMLPKICNPRENKRPNIPAACPNKISEIIKKTWSKNPFFRPTAKDIDYILVEMSSKEAERIESEQEALLAGARKPTSLFDVFPKHIAEALDAGKRVEPESHEMVTVSGGTIRPSLFFTMEISNPRATRCACPLGALL